MTDARSAAPPPAATLAPLRVPTRPAKPIRILIGVPAGGTQDILTRAIADAVKTSLGPIIIDNRSGAAGRIAVDVVKTAEPDGYTLLLGTAGMMTMFPSAYRKLGYDPVKDFVPIVNAASFELAMTVHRRAGDACKVRRLGAHQGTDGADVSFASYGAGTPSHFLGEMLNRAAGLKMVHVPYRGSTPARQDVMGGIVPVYFDTVGGALAMLPTPSRQGAGDERREALAADAHGCDLVELGYPDVIATGLVRVLRAGEDAAADRRPAARRVHEGENRTSSSSSPTTSASPTSAATAAARRSRRCSTGWPPTACASRRATRTRRCARRPASR